MLSVTEARKPSVQPILRKPSTNRRQVVKPTSPNPPSNSQIHAIPPPFQPEDNFTRLSGLARYPPRHGPEASPRQPDRTGALSRLSCPARGGHSPARGRDRLA